MTDSALDALRNIAYEKIVCAVWRMALVDQEDGIFVPLGASVEAQRLAGGRNGKLCRVV